MREIWKPVAGFERFMASNRGRVKGPGGSVLTPQEDFRGYMMTGGLKIVNGKFKRFLKPVHTLVLCAFHGPRPDGAQARHLNGDQKDNRIVNLKWGTPKENAADRKRHGHGPQGSQNPNAKLNESDIRAIRASKRPVREIARRFSVATSVIYAIRKRRTWRHVR